MEETVHLNLIFFVLHYICHIVNALVQIIGEVEKFHPSEMYKQPNVISI